MYGKDSACLFSSPIREYKIPSPIKFYIPEFLNNFASKHRLMSNITKAQYELALSRIEELLPLVDDNTPANDKHVVELTMMSDIVIEYEKEHYPIGKPTVTGRYALKPCKASDARLLTIVEHRFCHRANKVLYSR